MTLSTGSQTALGVFLLSCAILVSLAGGVAATPDTDAGPAPTVGQPAGHAELSVDPARISFGTTQVGEPVTRTVTLSNDSPRFITVSSIHIEGDTGAFAVVEPVYVDDSFQFSGGQRIPPGLSQEVTVQYAPQETGEDSVSVRIADADGNSLATVSASGTAVSGPDATVTPQSVDFEGVAVGQTRSETVTVTNDGDAPLRVTAASLRGDTDFDVASPAPVTLGPGQSEDVTVTFTPSAAASQTDLLEIRTNDSDRPVLPVTLSNSDTRTEVVTTESDGQRTVDVSVRNATAGERVDVPVPSGNESDTVDVEQISVTPTRGGDISLNVTDSPEPLPTTPDLETGDNAAGLTYINVTKSISNEDIEEVRYRYRISKERVANMTVDPAVLNSSRVGNDTVAGPQAITMYRYVDGQWQEERTRVVGESATHYEFVTIGDGFSEWTAAAKRPDIRIADASADVEAARVGDDVLIQVQLTNDGGADGIFDTRLLFNGTVVDQREVTVPDGSTVPVSFDQQVDQPRVYQVTVNDVPVADITVSSEGEAAVDDPAQNQADDDADSSSDESDESGGLLATQPVTVGVGALILLGVVGGLLYVRGGGGGADSKPAQQATDDDVVTVEGFDDGSDAAAEDVQTPADNDGSPQDQADRRDDEPPAGARDDRTGGGGSA
jgi:P pilus assembly chaperone PapD